MLAEGVEDILAVSKNNGTVLRTSVQHVREKLSLIIRMVVKISGHPWNQHQLRNNLFISISPPTPTIKPETWSICWDIWCVFIESAKCKKKGVGRKKRKPKILNMVSIYEGLISADNGSRYRALGR